MLAACLHFMKGTPYIYQGEELGMTNVHFTDLKDYRDIESIRAYEQYVGSGVFSSEEMMRYLSELGRDNARTPMQWDSSENAGFTTGTPWIRVNPNYKEINAAESVKDPDSVYAFYKQLIALRHKMPIMVYGAFRPLMEDSPSIYAYERILSGKKLTIACNFTKEMQPCSLFGNSGETELISNYKTHEDGMLQPYEVRVMEGNE